MLKLFCKYDKMTKYDEGEDVGVITMSLHSQYPPQHHHIQTPYPLFLN